MENKEQEKKLKQDVEAWNRWREEQLKETLDLREIKLNEADLSNANLRGADLGSASFIGALLKRADLTGTGLTEANLEKADLREAKLQGANLEGANLRETDIKRATLDFANLKKVNLIEANLYDARLVRADLSKANITGAILYGTARDDWVIDGITCDYVFWDSEGKERTPKDRNFRPGEFEELYKSLPTFEYYFEQGFTLVNIAVMDQVVQTINQQNPDYEVKLATLDSRGQPHAVFTVMSKDYVEPARKQITTDYEARLAALEGKQKQMMELISRLVAQKYSITAGGDVIIQQAGQDIVEGHKTQRTIQTGRDYLEQVAGDVTTGKSTNEHKDTKAEGSHSDAAPSEGKTREGREPS